MPTIIQTTDAQISFLNHILDDAMENIIDDAHRTQLEIAVQILKDNFNSVFDLFLNRRSDLEKVLESLLALSDNNGDMCKEKVAEYATKILSPRSKILPLGARCSIVLIGASHIAKESTTAQQTVVDNFGLEKLGSVDPSLFLKISNITHHLLTLALQAVKQVIAPSQGTYSSSFFSSCQPAASSGHSDTAGAKPSSF